MRPPPLSPALALKSPATILPTTSRPKQWQLLRTSLEGSTSSHLVGDLIERLGVLDHDAPAPGLHGSGLPEYLQEELLWKDAFELVHEEDLPLLYFLVSLVMEEPGASESAEVRFRDAGGEWALMDVCVLNVLEAPTGKDTGLLVVNVRQTRESRFWR